MAAKSKTRRWAYLTRPGGEDDLLDELPKSCSARAIAKGFVLAERGPQEPPAFARQAMRPAGPAVAARAEAVATALAKAIIRTYPEDRRWPWTLQVVPCTPDLRAAATAIDDEVAEHLDAALPRRIAEAYVDESEEPERIAQVWLVEGARAFIGFTPVDEAMTSSAGGQARAAREDDAASRSAAKLREAFDWLRLSPGAGELCVDLGAAPGGWTQVIVACGAKVIAVDRRPLAIKLPKKRFTPIGGDAFAFDPKETVDWVFADLNQRPLDVAKLVSKWGRRAWARHLVVSIKLPMKQKAKAVADIRGQLESAGWRGVKARQLPSDKNEVTMYAWLDPKIAGRGYQPPFSLGSKGRRK